MRRIIGKAIVAEIKTDLAESAGSLQLCVGQKAGCKAAAHAMRDIFAESETDGVLFVDASNAFNCLNRKALLHNYVLLQLKEALEKKLLSIYSRNSSMPQGVIPMFVAISKSL